MKLSSRRLLSISAVLMLLTAIAHTAGFMSSGGDQAEKGVEDAMRAFRFPAGPGMNPSMYDVYFMLVLMMALAFTAFGILNLMVAAAPDLSARLLRRIIRIDALWVAAFIALGAFYRIPPSPIPGIVIEIPLIAAPLVKPDECVSVGIG